MRRLVLSGGGNAKDSYQHHEAFAAWLDPDAPLLYLPGDAFPAKAALSWLSDVMVSFGIRSIEMWAERADYDPADIGRFSGIYIGGGNTFRLLNNLRLQGMMPALHHFIETGGPVFGGSAGAVLLGSDIMTCAHMDPNDVGITDTAGLGVVANFAIWCHYEPANDPLIAQFIAIHPLSMVAISERSALVVTGSKITALGHDGANRFDRSGKHHVPTGQSC